MRFSSPLLVVFSLSGLVSANLFITSPVATTKASAKKNFEIDWTPQNTTTPLPASFGPTTVCLMTGSEKVQYVLQTFGTLQNPAITVKVVATINPSAGPDSALYFIRFQSVSAIDPTTKQPLQAFSSRFALTDMTGTFTAAMNTANEGALSNTTSSSVAATSSTKSTSATGTRTNAIQTAGSSTGTGSTTSTRTATSSSATSSKTSGAASGRIIGGAGVAMSLVAVTIALVGM